jgi:hypothetical protein
MRLALKKVSFGSMYVVGGLALGWLVAHVLIHACR